MGKKKKQTNYIPLHMYGIWDKQEKVIKQVSLDPEIIEFDMLLLDEDRYSIGEFDICLTFTEE